MVRITTLALCALFIGGIAHAEDHHHRGGTGSTNPACGPAMRATKQAASALDQCVNAWKRDRKPGDHQPSDNCQNGFNNFSSAISSEAGSCTPSS